MDVFRAIKKSLRQARSMVASLGAWAEGASRTGGNGPCPGSALRAASLPAATAQILPTCSPPSVPSTPALASPGATLIRIRAAGSSTA